jgi:hypothetical protein
VSPNEVVYQGKLVEKLKKMFPASFILRPDPTDFQGIPDILILYGDRWAMLECKLSSNAKIQPNQDYYVNLFNAMSFCAIIYPAIEEMVLDDLQFAFGLKR